MTHTFAELVVSEGTYAEIASKLRDAGYDHAFLEDGAIDMHGIGVTKSKTRQPQPSGANHADECRSNGLDWWCVLHCATRNRDRLKAIGDRTPLQAGPAGLIDDDANWLIKQLGAAWDWLEKLEGLLTKLATSQYVHDRTRDSKAPKCPECRECIMYMPNDCGICEDLGKFVTDDSIAKHRQALGREAEEQE